MNGFFPIVRREFITIFCSSIAYVVAVFFLLVTGVSFYLMLSLLVEETTGVMMMADLFHLIFLWLLITVPVLTMRTFAEEKRSGCMESLMTAPVSDTAVVLAKYVSVLLAYMAIWVPTLLYPVIIQKLSSVPLDMDYSLMLAGYTGTWLIGAFYLAAGVFFSSLTRNQIIAAVMCFAFICITFFTGSILYDSLTPFWQKVGGYMYAMAHILDFARGVIDTRPLVLYVSGIIFFLFLTVKVVEARKWK